MTMPSLDDVYRKFGETSEAAQLLETELGNLLLKARATEMDLFSERDSSLARKILNSINKSTLGQILKQLDPSIATVEDLDELFSKALSARNRLSHSFYREHNFRRNTDEGRVLMMSDLDMIHETILRAYQAALAMSGSDSCFGLHSTNEASANMKLHPTIFCSRLGVSVCGR